MEQSNDPKAKTSKIQQEFYGSCGLFYFDLVERFKITVEEAVIVTYLDRWLRTVSETDEQRCHARHWLQHSYRLFTTKLRIFSLTTLRRRLDFLQGEHNGQPPLLVRGRNCAHAQSIVWSFSLPFIQESADFCWYSWYWMNNRDTLLRDPAEKKYVVQLLSPYNERVEQLAL